MPETSGKALRRFGPLLLVIAVCLPAPLHFFETFPNGWDQAEYTWCVKAGFLPHSPHVLFFLVARVVALVLAPAVALSTISLASGVAALVLLHRLLLRLYRDAPEAQAQAAALVATLLVGTSSVFVRQVATQEAYAFQLFTLLACAAVLAGSSRYRVRLGGLLFGFALAGHNGSVFALPALLVLVLQPILQAGSENSRTEALRAVATWLGIAGATLGVAYGITIALLPAAPGERLAEALHYFRGISPGPRLSLLADAEFLANSAAGILHRLTSGDIALTRGPVAIGPVGFGIAHLLLGAFGLLRLTRRMPAAALFLFLWALPFLSYELLLGASPDYGTYIVFVVPPVAAACGFAFAWPLPREPLRRAALTTGAAVVALALLATPALQLWERRSDLERDRARHDSPMTLAAAFAATSLPEDAVLVQSRREWNANLLPLYSERRHISRVGTSLSLLRSRAPYTPMKADAYDPLTTERLEQLLASGTPVIAFEARPLLGANAGLLDASRFVWKPSGDVDLEAGAAALGLAPEALARLAGRRVGMFRAELAPFRR